MPGIAIPAPASRRGQIEFIRLVRSERVRVMDARIVLSQGVVYEYVAAVLDAGRQERDVLYLGRRVKILRFSSGLNDILLEVYPHGQNDVLLFDS